jgi:hypothetical protein
MGQPISLQQWIWVVVVDSTDQTGKLESQKVLGRHPDRGLGDHKIGYISPGRQRRPFSLLPFLSLLPVIIDLPLQPESNVSTSSTKPLALWQERAGCACFYAKQKPGGGANLLAGYVVGIPGACLCGAVISIIVR